MPTLLVKNLSEELYKELRRLKVELGSRTWAELLESLLRLGPRESIALSEEKVEDIRKGVSGFLELRRAVSERWTGPPSVQEEFRKSRGHEGG